MKRLLFNLAANLSLLLALMVGALWGRSHRHDDTLMREKGTTVWTIGSFDGKLQYVKQRGLPHSPAAWRYIHWAPSQSLRWNLADQATRWYERLGFFYAYGTWKYIPGGPIQTLSVTFPDGSLLLLFLVLPLWRFLAWRKTRRNRQRGFEIRPPEAHPMGGGESGYREDDPWHSWINLVFGVYCERCPACVEIDWSLVHDGGGDDFLRQCAALAEQARKAGWTHLHGGVFLCPACSVKQPAADPSPAGSG